MRSADLTNGHDESVMSRSREIGKGGWIVQKFGGTSIGKFAVNIAEDIVRSVEILALTG